MTNQTKEPVLVTPKMIEKEWDISNCKRGYNKALQDVEKMIDEIPSIQNEVGKGCNNAGEMEMFRTGYKNGRDVFKMALKAQLRHLSPEGKK